MRTRPWPRALRWVLATAAIIAGLVGIGASEIRTHASGAPLHRPAYLTLGSPYRKLLAAGSYARIAFDPGALPRGSAIYLLAVGSGGSALAQESLSPDAAQVHAGAVAARVPAVAGRVSFWIALDPAEGSALPHLVVSPAGAQPAGTPLAATLEGVPAGDAVYLLGSYLEGAQGAAIADYVPPAACAPNPSTSGLVICNFTAPPGYAAHTVAFEGRATSGPGLPANDLPEAPFAAALPLLALPLLYLLMRRRGAAA